MKIKKTHNFRRKQVSLFFMILMSLATFAQDNIIQGRVTDNTGEPIPGVSVVLKGTELGTTSNFDGEYSIAIESPDTSILVFSFIGMNTVEINSNGKSVIDVSLLSNITAMDEVVIVGYGSQQKKDITGSVSIVKAEDFESRPNTQVASLLQGRATGVQVLSSSGKPGQ